MPIQAFPYRLALHIATIATLLGGIFVLTQEKRNNKSIIFAIFSFTVCTWSLLHVQLSYIKNQSTALLLAKLLNIPVVFIPVIFLHLVYIFTENKDYKKTIAIFYTISSIFALTMPFNIFTSQIQYIPNIGYYPTPTPIYNAFVIFYIVTVIIFLYATYKASTVSSGLERIKLGYIFYSALIGFPISLTYFLITYHPISIVNSYAGFGIPIYIFTITFAIFKYRFLDIDVIIKKTVIYGALYSICLGVFAAIVILLSQWFIAGNIDKRIIGLSIIAVMIIVPTVKVLDGILARITDKFLFHKKYDYDKVTKEATENMVQIYDLNKLIDFMMDLINKYVRVKHAAFCIFDNISGVYILENSLLLKPNNPVIQYLLKSAKPVICEEAKLLAKQNNDTALLSAIEEIDVFNINMCVPSILQGKLLGFLMLGEKLSGEPYSQEDLDLFNTLSTQISLSIENAKAYEELSTTKDKLFETEKLASIGRLAGGIAHEIKNPLAAIKTFTEYLDKKFDNEDFRDKFQKIVGSEVNRINYIVEQLVSYAQPKRIASDSLNLHEVIDEALSLLNEEIKKNDIGIIKQYAFSTLKLTSDHRQLRQVFINLFTNSIQAMKNINTRPRKLTITTEYDNSRINVEISDTGEGIAPENMSKIFEPFFTTKDSASGLGLAIVKGIVESYDGGISFTSKNGVGTTAKIFYPLRGYHGL